MAEKKARVTSAYREGTVAVISASAIMEGISFVAGLYGSLKTDDAIKALQAHVKILYQITRQLAARIEEVRDQLEKQIHEAEFRALNSTANSLANIINKTSAEGLPVLLPGFIVQAEVLSDALIVQLDRDWLKEQDRPEYYLAYLDLLIASEIMRFSAIALVDESDLPKADKITSVADKKEKFVSKLDFARDVMLHMEIAKYYVGPAGFLDCWTEPGSPQYCTQSYGYGLKTSSEVTIVTEVSSVSGGIEAIIAHDKAVAVAKEKTEAALREHCIPIVNDKWEAAFGGIRSALVGGN